MAEQKINEFIQDMLKAANLGGLGAEFQKEYAEKVQLEIEQRLIQTALERLNDAQYQELEGLLKNPTEQAAVMKFLEKNIPDFAQLMGKELDRFREEFIAQAKALEKVQA